MMKADSREQQAQITCTATKSGESGISIFHALGYDKVESKADDSTYVIWWILAIF